MGYISVSESQGDSALMYFVAPAQYLGDKRAAYNGALRFALRQSATSSLIPPDRFVLLGSDRLVLSFDLVVVPGTSWQTFEIPLNQNSGWRVASSLLPFGSSNQLATKQDLISALASLRMLWIRAEYSSNNYDRSDLDDVALLGQPSGALQPTLSAAVYCGISISGAVGNSYHIEYRDPRDANASRQGLTDIVLPYSPYFFIDRSSTRAPERIYRAIAN